MNKTYTFELTEQMIQQLAKMYKISEDDVVEGIDNMFADMNGGSLDEVVDSYGLFDEIGDWRIPKIC